METDYIQTWLDSVAISHSGAAGTQTRYRREIEAFLKYINAKPEDILADYKGMNERDFKLKYAQLLKAYLGTLMRQGYAPGSIGNFVYGVLSFFKHTDLPIGFVPPIRYRTVFHNRDIEASEIVKILNVSAPRERAFYTFMAQSGLRPTTICNLRLKNLEPDYSSGKVPCLVTVQEEITKGQYQAYLTFIGEDAIRYLKAYLNTRRQLSKESFLFTNQGTEDVMIYNTISSLFRKAVRILKEKGEMDYDQKKRDRPAEIRLYSLRKFFRKNANQAGFENVEFWMGHTGPGVDAHYRPKDPDFYRKIYAEKAMPFLRLESSTPTENEKEIEELRSKNAALEEKLRQTSQSFEERLANIERIFAVNEAEQFKQVLKAINESGKDRVQLSVQSEGKKLPPDYYTPESIEERRRQREEIIRKAKEAETGNEPKED